jgi:hypothetical protein
MDVLETEGAESGGSTLEKPLAIEVVQTQPLVGQRIADRRDSHGAPHGE